MKRALKATHQSAIGQLPLHNLVGEIGQRMAQRRQLPIQDPNDLRRAVGKHEVVDAVVPVNDNIASIVRWHRVL